MSKKFKSHASSARAASTFTGFGTFQTAASPLSYITEQPDLSAITEPNVVVSLKNLGKKDSTTKAKALDELLESIKQNADTAVLTAWSDLYPRTSIDNSQIVRRSAHTLQGILTANAGKKIVPLLPKLVPSWLAGTFDNDKSVARAASEALDKCFPSNEKKAALWKIYKDSIQSRVEDAILVQTTTTLSDERTTTSDEAETKYVRVVGTAVRLLGLLITEGLDNHEILQEKRLWEFAYHEDSYLRTSVCSLLRTILQKEIQDLDWTLLSTCFLYKGLNKSQIGSSQAFVSAVYDLSRVHPSVWTSDYTAKTPVSKRLLAFLRQGSQNGPLGVWHIMASWFESAIPVEAWKTSEADCDNVADAYRAGVVQERLHTDAAWASYMGLTAFLLKQLESQESKDAFAERHLSPVVITYITKSNDEKWRIGAQAENTARRALLGMSGTTDAVLQRTWRSCTDSAIEKIRLSLPESSKDFRNSQDTAAAQTRRLLNLQKVAPSDGCIDECNRDLLHAAIDLLKSRNGKPYGAAVVIEDLSREAKIKDEQLNRFLERDVETLLDSPSSTQLVSLALMYNVPIGQVLLSSKSDSVNIVRATEHFLCHASEKQLENEQIRSLVLSNIGRLDSDSGRAYALSALANSHTGNNGLRDQVLSRLVEVLGVSSEAHHGLSMLEALLSDPRLTKKISNSPYGPQISTKLLLLADADPSIADMASAINTSLTSTDQLSTSALPIIKQQLGGEGDSLSILTLVELGLKTFDHVEVEELLPTSNDWQRALQPHFYATTPRSLAITSSLRGVVWAVEPGVQQSPFTGAKWSKEPPAVTRDGEDFSLLFRLVFYVTNVFGPNISKLDGRLGATTNSTPLNNLYQWLPVALELINEKLTLDDANDIWLGSTEEVLQAASDVLSTGLSIIASWLDDDVFVRCWLDVGSSIEGTDRCSYLAALAFQRITSGVVSTRKSDVFQKFSGSLDSIHKSTNVIQSAALLSTLGEHLLATQSGLKIANELIAHVTSSPDDFTQLALLNILLANYRPVLEKVPQQRLVFLLKSLVGQIQDPGSGSVLCESLVLLSTIIGLIQDIYGEHWEIIVQGLVGIWATANNGDIPLIHSSLSVYTQLKSCVCMADVIEDLEEAWTSNKRELNAGLLHCLHALNTTSTDVDQPRTITAENLGRRLEDVAIPEDQSLFPLLSSGLPAVREAAYDLLHHSIPAKQEELSIDIALEDKLAELPKELMELIEDSTDAQRYLLSWKLVFDHFPKASFKLREAYTANLKRSSEIPKLLEFLCDRFRITSGRPIDASKFDIKEYDNYLVESEEHRIQWLSINTYYLLLTYLPSLTKDWYLEQKNRIKAPLESWTQKHLSPLIISSSLAGVNDWSAAQSSELTETDRPVSVKVTLTEVIASIMIDPESPPISLAISLPPAYPLESPSVTSRARVGVSEKNWQSWLRTFSVIIFSQGIVEGLVAFRRNVTGALKGQSECAICYSIIGTDMQTPNKKCQTCKNWFHGSCLYRWFRSSNSSSCPLCRNNFNYA